MKTIAISQRIDFLSERNEFRDSLDQQLVNFTALAGVIATPVPNTLIALKQLNAWLAYISPSVIILSGGNDIGEYSQRDLTEVALLEYAKINNLPVLGICRGMQMLGTFTGANLKSVSGHVGTCHQLVGQIEGKVNSFHTQSLINLPPCWNITARSKDGEIEAIRHINFPWEGWMWHPERISEFNRRDVQGLRDLFLCEH